MRDQRRWRSGGDNTGHSSNPCAKDAPTLCNNIVTDDRALHKAAFVENYIHTRDNALPEDHGVPGADE